MDIEKVGRFIKELRNEQHMSQEALAAKLIITRQAVSNWEVGKSLPDSEKLMELSDIFNITIKELLLGERNKTPENIEEIEEQDIAKTEDVDEENELDEKFALKSKKILEAYSNDYINDNKELENIALDLVDKYNDKSKILKKTSIILISTIITL